MELYTLRYVLAVADSGNFSLAAQACHVGQPALSQQIAKLEKELGVALFARNPRGATLTEAGKDFVLRAREILQRAQALQAENFAADVLKACQYFDLFYVICFCHDICHVCGNDRLNKCRIFRHGTCLCLFS